MDPAIISIVIIAIAMVMFLIPKIPLTITSVLCMVAMGLFGLTPYSSLFAGFQNNAVLLIAGMCVVGAAIVETGLAQKIGNVLLKVTGDREWMFILLVLVIGSLMSMFLNGAIVVAMFLPICDSLTISSKGKITRKHCYLPIGLQGPMGNNLTAVSASSMVTCCGILVDAGYRSLTTFEPTLVAAPALILTIVVYMLLVYPLSKKWLNYPDPPIEGAVDVVDTDCEEYKKAHPVWKMCVAGLTMVGTIVAFVMGVNWGAASLIAACVVVITGCLPTKKALPSISWSTCIIVACAMGFSAGLRDSGGGALIAQVIVDLAGPLGNTPFGMCVIMFIIGGIISQLMSDSGSVACVVPITMAIAVSMGWDPIPMMMCTAMGIKTALATPICVSCVTMAAPGGYRFIDYVKIGGIVTITQMVGILAMTYFVYYI